MRCGDPTAIARSVPAWILPMAGGSVLNASMT